VVTKLGLVLILFIVVGILIANGTIPLGEPMRSVLLVVVLLSLGALGLFRTREVISPWFASSRFILWILRGLGMVWLLLGAVGFLGIVVDLVGTR
jgi:hypothetical protein